MKKEVSYERFAISLVVVALIFGQMGCDIVRSEKSLASAAEGFIDPYLLGCWARIEEGPVGGIKSGDAALFVEQVGNTQLHVVSRDPDLDLVGYSVLLSGHKYFSGKGTDPEESFPYRIFHYLTYVPGFGDLEDDTKRELEMFRGRMLFVSSMRRSYVHEAIEAGLIDGDAGCKDCDGDIARLTAESDLLQSFVATHRQALFSPLLGDWAAFVRSDRYDPFALGEPDVCIDQSTSKNTVIDLSESDFD